MNVVNYVVFKLESLAINIDLWLTCCVILGKEHNLSEPWFYNLQNESNKTHLVEMLHRLDTKYMKCLTRLSQAPCCGQCLRSDYPGSGEMEICMRLFTGSTQGIHTYELVGTQDWAEGEGEL